MESALAWVGQIAQWIGSFFPRWTTLDLTQGAIKTEGFFLPARLRRFKEPARVTACGPGMHWWWPATTKWEEYSVAFQTDNLPSQNIETIDGLGITVGGMIGYRVSDVRLLLTRCCSPTMAVRTVTLPAVHAAICRMRWDDLQDAQRKGTIATRLRNESKKRLAEFGIDVDCVELTDMIRVRAFRLIQSTQQDDA